MQLSVGTLRRVGEVILARHQAAGDVIPFPVEERDPVVAMICEDLRITRILGPLGTTSDAKDNRLTVERKSDRQGRRVVIRLVSSSARAIGAEVKPLIVEAAKRAGLRLMFGDVLGCKGRGWQFAGQFAEACQRESR